MIITDRAITLTMPWAALMAMDGKRNETRGRATKFRGWLAIHAAKSFPAEYADLCVKEPFRSVLRTGFGLAPEDGDDVMQNVIETYCGRVLCVVNVIDCVPTKHLVLRGFAEKLSDQERAFGDYSEGRFYYVTEGVRQLREPFAARGFQSIPWKLERPITEDMLL